MANGGRCMHPDACDICDICGIVTPCPTKENVHPLPLTFTWCNECAKDQGAVFRFMTDTIAKYHADKDAQEPSCKSSCDKINQEDYHNQNVINTLMLLTFILSAAATLVITNYLGL